jgi:RimJ/RimL family protein N-acetyltransferase
MDFTKLNELTTENLILKKISESDRGFISEMFIDTAIRKYYIVPKEARQDYKNLLNYWFNDIANGAGFAWIIIKKGSGLFSKNKPCGFFAFEFRENLKNARISYALKSEYRGSGIITSTASHIINTLKNMGITTVEADIDTDNIASEKIVENLGFKTDKKKALVDPEMMKNGDIRLRFLWKKNLIELKDSSIKRIQLGASRLELTNALNDVISSIKNDGQHPKLLAKYFYLFGRIKFEENNYDGAKDAFSQCNLIIQQENLPENHETMYWFGRIREATGKQADARMYYKFALEKFSGDPELITKEEIQYALNGL